MPKRKYNRYKDIYGDFYRSRDEQINAKKALDDIEHREAYWAATKQRIRKLSDSLLDQQAENQYIDQAIRDQRNAHEADVHRDITSER